MKIIIKETNKKENLLILDQKTGINFIGDFIGKYGAFQDGQFVFNEELDAHICDQDTFDWWNKVVHDNQKLLGRMEELENEYGFDVIDDIVKDAGHDDLEYYAACINQALDEFLTKATR